MQPRPLDFVVIGAQKAGTTALRSYLASVPRLFLPEGEAPFFHLPRELPQQWLEHFEKELSAARPEQLLGKVSPHYMTTPIAPRQLGSVCPNAKLVAVLRDPVERAYSHYRMVRRWGVETRSFDEAVAELLAPNALARARALPPTHEAEPFFYLVWGEYGRILQHYLERFERAQLLLLDAHDLQGQTVRAVKSVLTHIGCDSTYAVADGTPEAVHVSAVEETVASLKRTKLIGTLWAQLPAPVRERIKSPLRGMLGRLPAAAAPPAMSDATRARLHEHFAQDAELLERRFSFVPRWM